VGARINPLLIMNPPPPPPPTLERRSSTLDRTEMARTDTGQGGQSLAGKILDAPLWSTLFGAHAFLNVYCTPCNDDVRTSHCAARASGCPVRSPRVTTMSSYVLAEKCGRKNCPVATLSCDADGNSECLLIAQPWLQTRRSPSRRSAWFTPTTSGSVSSSARFRFSCWAT